mmetsp:Transcript_53886/g.145174  ORF Transcript_53886/g.145174 Transcript_53886/m.145174 type:complete len:479 (+) Transcript_53886:131-1567(+)
MAVMAAMASLAAASAAAAATAAAAAARKPCTPPSDSWRICSETCCNLSSRDRSMSSLIISKWPGLAATSRPFSKRILRVPGTSWPCDNPGGATIPVKPLRSVFTIKPQSLTRLYGGNSSKARRVSIGVPDSEGGGGGGSSGGGGCRGGDAEAFRVLRLRVLASRRLRLRFRLPLDLPRLRLRLPRLRLRLPRLGLHLRLLLRARFLLRLRLRLPRRLDGEVATFLRPFRLPSRDLLRLLPRLRGGWPERLRLRLRFADLCFATFFRSLAAFFSASAALRSSSFLFSTAFRSSSFFFSAAFRSSAAFFSAAFFSLSCLRSASLSSSSEPLFVFVLLTSFDSFLDFLAFLDSFSLLSFRSLLSFLVSLASFLDSLASFLLFFASFADPFGDSLSLSLSSFAFFLEDPLLLFFFAFLSLSLLFFSFRCGLSSSSTAEAAASSSSSSRAHSVAADPSSCCSSASASASHSLSSFWSSSSSSS